MPLLVIPSLEDLPLSVCKLKVGDVGSNVSTVKFNVPTLEVFPATSLCLTCKFHVPWVLTVKLEPEPAVHWAPLLNEYSQVAPDSRPPTRTTPLLVRPSLEDLPLSVCKLKVGVAGSNVSKVKLKFLAKERFPAKSLCRTSISFTP